MTLYRPLVTFLRDAQLAYDATEEAMTILMDLGAEDHLADRITGALWQENEYALME